MRRNVWIAGLTILFAAGTLTMAPAFAFAAETLPQGIYAGELDLAGVPAEEAKETVSQYVEEKLDQEVVLVIDGNEAKAGAGELGLSWGNQEEFEEALKEAVPSGNLIRRYMKTKDLEVAPVELPIEVAADAEKVSAFVNEKCGGIITQAALSEAVLQAGSGEIRVEAVTAEQQPEITTEDLSTIQDVLGTFSTSFSSSSTSRATNLEVGAAKINGHVLMPGEVLSGYECMQPFTVENGYRAATAYENGRSVDSIGGGVCQISTTLYNAALFAEMEIVQRQNHSMTVAYVKPSMDAAIAGTYKDLKFKNPYDTPVYVEGTTEGRTLTFTIYGKETRPENRTLAFESETLQTIDPGAPTEQVDASLAPGQRVRVQSSHTGLKSRLFKCVYVDGELTERTLLHNDTYNASKAIYRVGPAVPAVTEPTEPVPTESAPAETIPEPTSPAETSPAPAPGYEFGPGMVPMPSETTGSEGQNSSGPGGGDSTPAQVVPAGPGA